MTSREEIKEWFERGVKQGDSHLIVMCDTFDWDDYPTYALSEDDARQIVADKNGVNMQQVMEVYNLKLPMEQQLDQYRAFNY